MDMYTRQEMDLEEKQNELEIIDMELQTAQWEDRKDKLRLKRSILESIRKLEDRIYNKKERRYIEEDNHLY
jgi:hypothetical protein